MSAVPWARQRTHRGAPPIRSHPAPPAWCFWQGRVTWLWSRLWNRVNTWKRSRLFSIRSFWQPPIARHAGPNEIVQHWYATPCGSTSGNWRFAPGKNATAKATRNSRQGIRNHSFGKRRQRGRQNSPRRCPPVPVCPARQEQTSGCAYSRQLYCLSIDRHRSADHLHDPWCPVGGDPERRGWHESALCSQSAQRGYGLATAVGEARGSAKSHADAGNLRRTAL